MSAHSHLSRREFLKKAGTGALLSGGVPALLGGPARAPARAPNIVVVLTDQMRFCDMGCAGNPYIRTPRLDRLAAQGTMLTNAFACTPLCSPCRAQMLTGRYGAVTGVIANGVKLPESEVTIAEELKARGYATGFVGKWHLEGGQHAPRGDARHAGWVPRGPARQGFDFWAANDLNHDYFHAHYYRDTPEPIRIDGYEPSAQVDQAVEFMSKTREQPFLLIVSFGPPHNPYRPPAAFDIYDPAKIPLRPNVPSARAGAARQKLAAYYGLISSVDHETGRLLDAIDRLGVADRTAVYFTSDHGDMHHSQGELFKQRPWEESIHVPSIVRYPGKVAAGVKRDTLLGSVDVMPTLLGLCALPAPRGVQGKDLSSSLLGKGGPEPEAVLLANYAAGGGGGRLPAWRALRTKDWLFAISATSEPPGWLLYDLKTDPFQTRNLIGDPKYREVRERLRTLLQRMREETRDSVAMDAGFAALERARGGRP